MCVPKKSNNDSSRYKKNYYEYILFMDRLDLDEVPIALFLHYLQEVSNAEFRQEFLIRIQIQLHSPVAFLC